MKAKYIKVILNIITKVIILKTFKLLVCVCRQGESHSPVKANKVRMSIKIKKKKILETIFFVYSLY